MRKIILMILFVVLTVVSQAQTKYIKFDDLIKGEISGLSYSNNLLNFVSKEYIDGVYLRNGMQFDIKEILDSVNGRFNIDTLKLNTRKIKFDLIDDLLKLFSNCVNNYMKNNNLRFDIKSDTIFVLNVTISGCVGDEIGPIHVKSKKVNITGEVGDNDDIIPIRKGIYGKPLYVVDDEILNILHSWDEKLMKEKTARYIPTTFYSRYYSLYRFIIRDGEIMERSIRLIPY